MSCRLATHCLTYRLTHPSSFTTFIPSSCAPLPAPLFLHPSSCPPLPAPLFLHQVLHRAKGIIQTLNALKQRLDEMA
jgi:hypothetical protein